MSYDQLETHTLVSCILGVKLNALNNIIYLLLIIEFNYDGRTTQWSFIKEILYYVQVA